MTNGPMPCSRHEATLRDGDVHRGLTTIRQRAAQGGFHMRAWITAVALLLALLAGGVSTALGNDLAAANGDWLRVIDAETGARVKEVNRYAQVTRLDYRPDGQRLAVGICTANRIVELETSAYAEVGVPITAS